MVNYGAAFKLPFTSLNRSTALFLIAAVASLAQISYKIISDVLKNGAGQYSGQTVLLSSAWLVSVVLGLFFSTVISGYSIRIAANAMRGKNEMPPFDNVPSLIGSGFKYFGATLIYALPVLLFIILIVVAAATKSLVLLLFTGIIGVIVIFLWFLFMLYCGAMLLAHFAHENRFAAFFEFRKILKYSFTSAYFVPWMAAIGYSIGIGIPYIILAFIVGLFTDISPLAMLFLVPFSALFTVIITPTATNLYGQAYRDVIAGREPGAKQALAAPTVKAKRSSTKK